jgi:flagellar biosynthesis component FlhA
MGALYTRVLRRLAGLRGWDFTTAALRPVWLFVAVLVAVGLLLGPVPSLFLDVLLGANLILAIALCGAAAMAGEPLRMPQLPALLLTSVLLRLGVNVAALRLILSDGDAGWLIRGSGALLGGDALIGGVLIATIGGVEYLVLARGGERVAEVAARFVLDALPGRQAAIEADLRSGAIDQTQAQDRRAALDREAQIYGALDGALRLLKGDVAAALLLLVAGLLGGVAFGVLRQGLELGEAAERYALLVIGQGLLTQVPVVLNSAAAGLLLSRGAAATRRADESRRGGATAAVSVEAGPSLGLDAAAIETVREKLAHRLGFAMPRFVLLQATGIATGRRLSLRLFGAQLSSGELPLETDGRSALLETLLPAAADLLTIDVVQEMLNGLGRTQPALVRETVPRRIDLGRLTALLRRLLGQRVWPLDVRAVLETIATLPRLDTDLEVLTEQVRGGLGRFLIQGLLRGRDKFDGLSSGPEGLPALLLANEIEELLREARDGQLEPELSREIVQGVQAAKKLAPDAALLCHADVRRAVEKLLLATPEALPVLAYSELLPSIPVVVVGRVEPGSGESGAAPFVDSAAVPWQMRSRI